MGNQASGYTKSQWRKVSSLWEVLERADYSGRPRIGHCLADLAEVIGGVTNLAEDFLKVILGPFLAGLDRLTQVHRMMSAAYP